MPPKSINLFASAIAAAMTLHAACALAAEPSSMTDALKKVEHEWAHIMYQVTDKDAQEDQLKSLAAVSDKIVADYPGRAEPLIWDSVVTSSEARFANPFSALGLAKRAREMLEQAGRIDYHALDGAVPTSLGTLYFMVPGFPIGFGDDDKARQYLEEAIAISPKGIDSNFFYGDFLFRQKDYENAAVALKRVLDAPNVPDRPVWDAGRRAEARKILKQIDDIVASNR